MPFRALLKAALLLATVVRLCFSGCLSVGTLTAGAAGAAGGAGGAVGAGGGLRCAAVAAVAPSRVALRVMRVGEPARGQMFEEPESAEPEPAPSMSCTQDVLAYTAAPSCAAPQR